MKKILLLIIATLCMLSVYSQKITTTTRVYSYSGQDSTLIRTDIEEKIIEPGKITYISHMEGIEFKSINTINNGLIMISSGYANNIPTEIHRYFYNDKSQLTETTSSVYKEDGTEMLGSKIEYLRFADYDSINHYQYSDGQWNLFSQEKRVETMEKLNVYLKNSSGYEHKVEVIYNDNLEHAKFFIMVNQHWTLASEWESILSNDRQQKFTEEMISFKEEEDYLIPHYSKIEHKYDEQNRLVKSFGWTKESLEDDWVFNGAAYIEYTTIANPLNAPKEQSLSIYPNPATDQVTIQHLGKQPSLTVYDQSGKKLDLYIHQEDNESEIDLTSIPAGKYLIKTESKTYHIIKK